MITACWNKNKHLAKTFTTWRCFKECFITPETNSLSPSSYCKQCRTTLNSNWSKDFSFSLFYKFDAIFPDICKSSKVNSSSNFLLLKNSTSTCSYFSIQFNICQVLLYLHVLIPSLDKISSVGILHFILLFRISSYL